MAPEEPPTFSVVVPAFNAERTIELTVRSVLAQTRGDFEVIVVDNGSTDATAERVERLTGDPRVRLVSEARRGPAAARNAALGVARGRYVSFLDSDDVYLPDYLQTMVETLEQSGGDVAYTDAWTFDEATQRILRRPAHAAWRPKRPPANPGEFLRALLWPGNFVLISVLAPRALVVDAGGFRPDLVGTEDWELWLRLSAQGRRFVEAPRVLVVKRWRAGQLSGDTTAMVEGAREVYRIVAEEYDVPAEVRALAARGGREYAGTHRAPRRVPRLLRLPYRLLWTLRWFFLRPPRDVRPLMDDLRRVTA